MQGLRELVMQKATRVFDGERLDLFSNSFDRYVDLYDQLLRMVQQLFNPMQ